MMVNQEDFKLLIGISGFLLGNFFNGVYIYIDDCNDEI